MKPTPTVNADAGKERKRTASNRLDASKGNDMKEYVIDRTDGKPGKFTGTKLGEILSPNAQIPDRETTSRQWFTIDVYRTEKGTVIAHVKYDAGSKLGREQPVMEYYTAKDLTTLIEKLNAVAADEVFTTGWPGNGDPEENGGQDMRRNDSSVRHHANREFQAAVQQLRKLAPAGDDVDIIE